jgi:hypothetical protein
MTLKELRFQIDLWTAARTLPFRVYGRSLSEILDLSRARRPNTYRGLSSDYIVKATSRMVRRPFVMRDRRCLREGLLAFHFLEAAGFAPKLYFGIDRSTLSRPDVKAHCWVVCDEEAVLNPPSADMFPILVWPNTGRALELPNDLIQANFD